MIRMLTLNNYTTFMPLRIEEIHRTKTIKAVLTEKTETQKKTMPSQLSSNE